MLTVDDEKVVAGVLTASACGTKETSETAGSGGATDTGKSRLARAMRVEWLGQTTASICWIASVLTYGISSSGDWLQLCAATGWLIANIASLATAGAD